MVSPKLTLGYALRRTDAGLWQMFAVDLARRAESLALLRLPEPALYLGAGKRYGQSMG